MSAATTPTVTLPTSWIGQQLTHMPFLSPYRLGYLLVFARSPFRGRRASMYSPSGTSRIWRLAWSDCNPRVGRYNPVQPLHTGLPPYELECSPCLSLDSGEVHLSFVGTVNHGRGRLEHHLFRMSGPSLDRLSPAVRVNDHDCYAGFWRPDQVAWANGNDGVVRLRGTFNARLDTGFVEVLRISFRAESVHQILITGRVPDERRLFRGRPVPRTIIYDLEQRKLLGEIQNGGDSVYKPTICGEWLATVVPGSRSGRESLKIIFVDQFTVEPPPMEALYVADP